jgi:hypothetical protein
VSTLLEQSKKLVMHQVTMNREILQSKITSEDSFTKKEIQKKNCLTLIVKNCNIVYPRSAATQGLRQIMEAINIVQAYYSRGDSTQDLHIGIRNLEVINPTVYKQFVRKNLKVLYMYAKCTLHPHSLDGTSCPTEQTLKELGFIDVNTAIVNAMTAISNQPTANSS